MQMLTYIQIISLNVNRLNAPTKRHRWANWIYKQDPYIYAFYKRPTSDLETHTDWNWEDEKYIPYKWKLKQSKNDKTHVRQNRL